MQPTVSPITTSRLLLRPVVDADIADIHRGLSDPTVTQYYDVHFATLEATEEQMSWYREPAQAWWTIRSGDGSDFYGAVGFNDMTDDHRCAEIGLWLLPAYWGRGFMGEAMRAVTQYGLQKMRLARIEGYVDSANLACKRAMAKLDFALERTLENEEIKDGRPIDVEVYVKAAKTT